MCVVEHSAAVVSREPYKHRQIIRKLQKYLFFWMCGYCDRPVSVTV